MGKRIFLLLGIFVISMCSSHYVYASDFIVKSDVIGVNELKVVISVNDAPNSVAAMGFDFVYDPECLMYNSHSFKELTGIFLTKSLNRSAPGILRVGAFAIGRQIDRGASGELLVIKFETMNNCKQTVLIERLADGIASWEIGLLD